MSLTLVILAAGIGSRYGGLKQMEPVGPAGEFLLDYSVFDALRAGFSRIVFVLRRDIEDAFRAAMGRRIERRAAVAYVRQELTDLPAGFSPPAERRKPWGTGHALLAAAAAVREPFGVANADDFYGRASYETLAAFLRATAAEAGRYALVGFRLRQTLSEHGAVARGVGAVDAAGNLRTIEERVGIEKAGAGARYRDERGAWQSLAGDEPVSMNMWGFKPDLFPHLRDEFHAFLQRHAGDAKAEFFLPAAINTLIARGAVSVAVLPTPETWFGVTYPEEKTAVVHRIRELVAAGVYPPALWDAAPPDRGA